MEKATRFPFLFFNLFLFLLELNYISASVEESLELNTWRFVEYGRDGLLQIVFHCRFPLQRKEPVTKSRFYVITLFPA